MKLEDFFLCWSAQNEGHSVNLREIIFFVKLCSVMLESPKTIFLGLAKKCFRISVLGCLDNGEAGKPSTEFHNKIQV